MSERAKPPDKNKRPKSYSISTIIITVLAAVIALGVLFYLIIFLSWGPPDSLPPTEHKSPDSLPPKQHRLRVPDLIGYSADEAASELKRMGISASLITHEEVKFGSTNLAPQGYLVVAQDPKPGSRIKNGTAVKLLIAPSETSSGKSDHPQPDSKKGVDDFLEKMDWGNITFNSPPNMEQYDVAIIDLLLDFRKPMEELKTELKEKMDTHIPMQVQQQRVRVLDRMEARLTGTGFEITAVTPILQAISRYETTTWKWQIKPISSGAQYLHLTLTAILTINGKDIERAIRTFDKRIEVNVSWSSKIGNFLSNNWQWLWAAIFVPLLGWLWKRRQNKRSVNNSKDDSAQNTDSQR